jgi:3-dehydroquinate dehydratase type I
MAIIHHRSSSVSLSPLPPKQTSLPTPTPLALLLRCHAAGADVVKFATTARDVRDALRVLRALRASPYPTIALAMGERGQITRLLAPK